MIADDNQGTTVRLFQQGCSRKIWLRQPLGLAVPEHRVDDDAIDHGHDPQYDPDHVHVQAVNFLADRCHPRCILIWAPPKAAGAEQPAGPNKSCPDPGESGLTIVNNPSRVEPARPCISLPKSRPARYTSHSPFAGMPVVPWRVVQQYIKILVQQHGPRLVTQHRRAELAGVVTRWRRTLRYASLPLAALVTSRGRSHLVGRGRH